MALTGSLTIGPDRHGRTVAISHGLVTDAPQAGARHLPCPDGEIAPGAVCAHTHLYSGLARYLPPADLPPENFLAALERVWWRLDRAIDADILRAAARDYVARALLSGTTALADHHESPSFIEGSLAVLATACEELGMRALLCYGATERNAGPREAWRGLAECRAVSNSALVRGLVGLHAGFTVSDRTIREAGDRARELGTVLHVHLAEDAADVDDARRRGFTGPLERLGWLGALIPGSILAHGVHLDADQARMASDAGCWLVHNPRSNEANRVGYASSLSAASRVALGADGWDADMTVEAAALSRLAAHHGDIGIGGRLAAGHGLLAERFGTASGALTDGALGDLVVRREGAVRYVVVAGRLVIDDGVLVTGDATAIEAEARSRAADLADRMARI